MIRESAKFTDKLDFLKASERLEKISKKTNIIYSERFSEAYGNEIFIKPENLQKTGAFKIRGAYNKISKMSEEEKRKALFQHLRATMPKELPILLKNWVLKRRL